MLAKDPDDLFLNFALAMEHAKDHSTEQAVRQFDRVLEIDPNHVPAYLQKAHTLIDAGQPDEARQTLTAGIAAAKAIGDNHAADEMSGLLKML